MSWIKDFRKSRGLTQMQMALFAGITRNYYGLLEGRASLPEHLNGIFLELKQEFEAQERNEANPTSLLQNPAHSLFSQRDDLQLKLEKKSLQWARLRGKLKRMENNVKKNLLLYKVCQSWKEKKQPSDPHIEIKMAPLEAWYKINFRKNGFEKIENMRIRIETIQEEIKILQEKIEINSKYLIEKRE